MMFSGLSMTIIFMSLKSLKKNIVYIYIFKVTSNEIIFKEIWLINESFK